MTLDYWNYGVFLIMGNAGFISSAEVLDCIQKDRVKSRPELLDSSLTYYNRNIGNLGRGGYVLQHIHQPQHNHNLATVAGVLGSRSLQSLPAHLFNELQHRAKDPEHRKTQNPKTLTQLP